MQEVYIPYSQALQIWRKKENYWIKTVHIMANESMNLTQSVNKVENQGECQRIN